MLTRSFVMTLPIESTPAAPIPQKALAAIKLPILSAAAHHAVVAASSRSPARYKGRRPNVSDSRPISGWRDVEVSRKAVDSHDAEFDALKYDVMTGWLDAINVLSNMAI
jgi:hypothetical protein